MYTNKSEQVETQPVKELCIGHLGKWPVVVFTPFARKHCKWSCQATCDLAPTSHVWSTTFQVLATVALTKVEDILPEFAIAVSNNDRFSCQIRRKWNPVLAHLLEDQCNILSTRWKNETYRSSRNFKLYTTSGMQMLTLSENSVSKAAKS